MATYEDAFIYEYEIARDSLIHFHITNACPDNCKHCYMDSVSPFSKKRIDLDKDKIKSVLEIIKPETRDKEVVNVRNTDVILSGGEPLIHEDFSEIIDYLKNKNYEVIIISSGLPLIEKDTEIWDSLKKLDSKDRLAISNDELHRITKEEIKEIEKYAIFNNYSMELSINFYNYLDRIIPSKRAVRNWSDFDFDSNFYYHEGSRYIKTNPRDESFGKCMDENDIGKILFNPKGEFLYCLCKQDDPVGSIDDLIGMDRETALDYLAEKIYNKQEQINEIFYEASCPVNCYNHINGL
ncbi:MAG: radical SAM protein [Candidatus Aenigmarchaeota archaeon]|nr:radical SAM protein [Candidatus Aenigmarchaeota archaeon]